MLVHKSPHCGRPGHPTRSDSCSHLVLPSCIPAPGSSRPVGVRPMKATGDPAQPQCNQQGPSASELYDRPHEHRVLHMVASQRERCRPLVPFTPTPLLPASLNHILGPSLEDLGQDLLGSLQLNEFMISYLPGLDELGFPPPRQPHEYASRVAWLLIGS